MQNFFGFRYYSTFVCLWQILSNHGVAMLKRFVSRFTDKLFFENMHWMYSIKRRIRVLQQKPNPVRLPQEVTPTQKNKLNSNRHLINCWITGQRPALPQAPWIQQPPRATLHQGQLAEDQPAAEKICQRFSHALLPEVPSDNEEERVKASTDLLRKPFSEIGPPYHNVLFLDRNYVPQLELS